MNAATFPDYALGGTLSPDATYTVEMLIERVRGRFDPDCMDEFFERVDAREAPGYKPHFSRDHVEPAARELLQLNWLSFQRLRDAARPIRDLTAIRFLPQLTGLVLIDNEVADISPLSCCT